MFRKVRRVTYGVRYFMWIVFSSLSLVNYVLHEYMKHAKKDLSFISSPFFTFIDTVQYYAIVAFWVFVICLVLFYTLRVCLFFSRKGNKKVNMRLAKRSKRLNDVFENMKIPDDKYPKWDYETNNNLLVLTIYKNFYIDMKMIADNLAKFEQVFKLQATKIEEVGFDKINIYFVLHEQILKLTDLALDVESYALCLGQSLHELLMINLNLTPHLLIAGSNGSGKTSFMRFLYYQFKQQQDKGRVKIILFDGKGNEFADYANDSLVVYKDFLTELEQVHTRMKQKYVQLREHGWRSLPAEEERCVLIIDEYTSILANLSKEDKKRFEQVAGDIARLGRSAGYNMIIGLQRADANIIQGEIKENMTKVLLGSASDEAKRIMFARTDIINQPRGSGNVLIDDVLSVFQFPYVQ